MRSVQNFITIAARHGKDMRPFLMRSVGRNPQRLAAQNAAERAFLRSGVPSRSGSRVMGLDGLTGNYTGPAAHPAGEPHRPTQWGPEQAPCTSGDRKHGGERTLPREGDGCGCFDGVCGHGLVAPPSGLGRVAGTGNGHNHENMMAAFTRPFKASTP